LVVVGRASWGGGAAGESAQLAGTLAAGESG